MMDTLNQKPTNEMLYEAQKLAFFLEETLPRDIADNYHKTAEYIQHYTNRLLHVEAASEAAQPLSKTQAAQSTSFDLGNLYLPATLIVIATTLLLHSPV